MQAMTCGEIWKLYSEYAQQDERLNASNSQGKSSKDLTFSIAKALSPLIAADLG
jgi:hypothetical protein